VKKYGEPAAMYFASLALQLFQPWMGKSVEGYEYYTEMAKKALENLQQAGKGGMKIPRTGANSADGGSCVGSPDSVMKSVQTYADNDVDQMVFLVQCGKIPHEKIVESLKVFGKEVIPAFKERAEEREAKQLLAAPTYATVPDWAKLGPRF